MSKTHSNLQVLEGYHAWAAISGHSFMQLSNIEVSKITLQNTSKAIKCFVFFSFVYNHCVLGMTSIVMQCDKKNFKVINL